MKHRLLSLALAAAVALATGWLAYRSVGDPDVRDALADQDAMAWLRTEFSLTDEQYARIKALHASYAVECEAHCRAIQEAARGRNALKATGAPAEEIARADAQFEALREVCETAIAGHVRRCAAEMSPEAGQRYLSWVLPKIADFDHRAPPSLTLNPSHSHP